MSMRAGHIWRQADETGVSGTGRVAEWIEYTDGFVVVRWMSNMASTNLYQNMKQAESVHSHGGKTAFVVDWKEPAPNPAEEDSELEVSGESEVGPLEEEPQSQPEPVVEPKKSRRSKAAAPKKEKS